MKIYIKQADSTFSFAYNQKAGFTLINLVPATSGQTEAHLEFFSKSRNKYKPLFAYEISSADIQESALDEMEVIFQGSGKSMQFQVNSKTGKEFPLRPISNSTQEQMVVPHKGVSLSSDNVFLDEDDNKVEGDPELLDPTEVEPIVDNIILYDTDVEAEAEPKREPESAINIEDFETENLQADGFSESLEAELGINSSDENVMGIIPQIGEFDDDVDLLSLLEQSETHQDEITKEPEGTYEFLDDLSADTPLAIEAEPVADSNSNSNSNEVSDELDFVDSGEMEKLLGIGDDESESESEVEIQTDNEVDNEFEIEDTSEVEAATDELDIAESEVETTSDFEIESDNIDVITATEIGSESDLLPDSDDDFNFELSGTETETETETEAEAEADFDFSPEAETEFELNTESEAESEIPLDENSDFEFDNQEADFTIGFEEPTTGIDFQGEGDFSDFDFKADDSNAINIEENFMASQVEENFELPVESEIATQVTNENVKAKPKSTKTKFDKANAKTKNKSKEKKQKQKSEPKVDSKKEERERAKIEKLQQREMEKRLKEQKKIQKLKKPRSIVPGVVVLLFFGISALVAFFVVKYLI